MGKVSKVTRMVKDFRIVARIAVQGHGDPQINSI